MIIERSVKNLNELGLKDKNLNDLLKAEKDYSLECNEGKFYYSKDDNKIHTEIDYYRKSYFKEDKERFPYNCLDLVPEYFELKLSRYLRENEILLGVLFNKKEQTKEFILEETKKAKERVQKDKDYINKYTKQNHESKIKGLNIYKGYLFYLENKLKELDIALTITPRVQNLFNFIDFLHSNIENFKNYDETIKNLHLLDKKCMDLDPTKNFREKLEHDKALLEFDEQSSIIENNIIQPIKLKAINYNICDWGNLSTIWNYNFSDINKLGENFTADDVQLILKKKQKYIEFREKNKHNNFIDIFFFKFDKLLNELFDFFNVSDRNEFENFETKTLKYKVDWECKEKNIQKPNPVEVLLMSLDLLKDLELYPDVKCDVVEVLDSLRTYYSENLTNSFKSFVSKKTVL